MRTLNRPMFRSGGSAGTGITSGLEPRKRYEHGGTHSNRGMSNLSRGLIDFGLNMASATPSGSIFSTAAEQAKGPFANYQKREAAQAERDFTREQYEEQKKQFGQKLEQDRYLGELAAQGEKQFIEEQINNYWDPLIEAETDEEKKKLLLQEKAADKYNVIVMGADISDKYKILSNAEATEQAVSSAETEIGNTINPDTNVNWVETDAGYSEKLQSLINKYLRLATKFLEEDKKADGGRIGRAVGGSMTEDVNVMTKTPGGIADINVSETVERDPEQTNQIDISYEQLRDRLPAEISNEIVLLLSESYEAFSDFAEIQTQADVNEFNTKYNVQLFLPQQSGV